jgi:hypothetical protein
MMIVMTLNYHCCNNNDGCHETLALLLRKQNVPMIATL